MLQRRDMSNIIPSWLLCRKSLIYAQIGPVVAAFQQCTFNRRLFMILLSPKKLFLEKDIFWMIWMIICSCGKKGCCCCCCCCCCCFEAFCVFVFAWCSQQQARQAVLLTKELLTDSFFFPESNEWWHSNGKTLTSMTCMQNWHVVKFPLLLRRPRWPGMYLECILYLSSVFYVEIQDTF